MKTNPVYITGSSAFLPNAPVGNDDMERLIGQIGDKPSRVRRTILRSNGIRQRHYAIDPCTLRPNHTNASMTAAAIRRLLAESPPGTRLHCLCCGTSIADQLLPNHALMVQGELRAQACEAVATTGICLAGVAALKYGYLAVKCGEHPSAVVSGSDLASAMIHARRFSAESAGDPAGLEQHPELAFDKDFLRWMLSDGAGAFLLEARPPPGRIALRIDWIDIVSYAGEMPVCMYAGAEKNADGSLAGWTTRPAREVADRALMCIQQDVRLLNEHVVDYTVAKPLRQIAAKRSLDPAAVDFFLPHYSSGYFRDKVHESMRAIGFDVPQSKWFTNLERCGNTGSAAFYVMLDELFHSGRLRPGRRLLGYVPESGRFSTAFLHLTVT
jgi:3-oxoacyl-[acyl-carrier-protein] synthase-3